jgi:thioesterase domain-containing protein/acyl carrier protein
MSATPDNTDDLQQRIARLTTDRWMLLKRRLKQASWTQPEEQSGETDSRIVAYFTTRPGAEAPAAQDLRRFLAERLPAHLIPSRFSAIESLPQLPNGKADRAALSARIDSSPAAGFVGGTTTTIERQLMRIWGDVLDVVEVSRDDNFFELGGHSLLLPRLADRIQQDFGVALPLGAMFQAPTVKSIAELILARNPAHTWRSLVPIRETGSRPPLYLVHGLGGEIGYFYNLAGYLGPDQPVFGLQAPMEPFAELEPMVSHYLGEVKRHQPHGPYLLGGYCVGGCVAFEMARQLTAAGEAVHLLAIIDALTPGLQPIVPRLGRRLKKLVRKHPRDIAAALRRRTTKVAKALTDITSAQNAEIPQWYGVPPAFHEIATRHYRAVLGYTPQPYAGNVWLFRSEDDRFPHDMGWSAFVRGSLDICIIPGRHADVLKEPHLGVMARRLSQVLDSLTEAAI